MNSKDLANMIKLALDNSLTRAEIAKEISSIRTDESLLGEILHQLQHFIDDEDIRSKDNEYDRLLRTQLEEALSCIERSNQLL